MGYTKAKTKAAKIVTREPISGFYQPVDVPDGEFGMDAINKRAAAQVEAMIEGTTADWSKPGDDSPSLGNAVSQLRKSVEKYTADDDGKR